MYYNTYRRYERKIYMEYIKLKVTSKDDAKRFYRTIAIKGDPDLYTLGALIGTAVHAWFEHMYLFHNKQYNFVPDMWMDNYYMDNDLPMSKYHLSDLGEKFVFEYDTGEGYEFNCRVMKRKIEYKDAYDEEPFAFVVDGKGAGIFENDHYTLMRYLNGEIDPNSNDESMEENWRMLPMNMEFEKYGDFDNPLDLDRMVYFDDEFEEITNHFKMDIDDGDEDIDDKTRDTTDEFIDKVAGDIFRISYINDIFEELLKTHELNEAFGMIVDATIQTLIECGDSLDDFEEIRKKKLESLNLKN